MSYTISPYQYTLEPNNKIVVDKFKLSIVSNGSFKYCFNRFIVPPTILKAIIEIEVTTTMKGVPASQTYKYPYGTDIESGLVAFYAYGTMFGSFPDPLLSTDYQYIFIGAPNALAGIIVNDTVVIDLKFKLSEIINYKCTIEIPGSALEVTTEGSGYATLTDATSILGKSLSGRTLTDYVRKFELVNLDADDSPLTKYGNNDFVNIPDIARGKSKPYIFHLPLRSNYKEEISGQTITAVGSGMTSTSFNSSLGLYVAASTGYLSVPNFKLLFPKVETALLSNAWTFEYYMRCDGADCQTNFFSFANNFTYYSQKGSLNTIIMANIGRNGWNNYFNYNGNSIANSGGYSFWMKDQAMRRFTITYNNGKIRRFIDGVEFDDKEGTYTKLTSLESNTLYLWRSSGYNSAAYIHDITIWDRVLTDTEIKNHTEFN